MLRTKPYSNYRRASVKKQSVGAFLADSYLGFSFALHFLVLMKTP